MSIEVMGGGGGVELPSWKYITHSSSKDYDDGDVCWGGDKFVAVKHYYESGNGYDEIESIFEKYRSRQEKIKKMNKLILIIITLICMCKCTEQIRDNPMTSDYVPVTKI